MNRDQLRGKVQTVLGVIPPDDLGITLPHEHALFDASVWFEEPEGDSAKIFAHQPVSIENLGWVRYHPSDNLDNVAQCDEQIAIDEILRYRRAGGCSILDPTPIGIGRNPKALANISRATGINIVMGTGYYVKEAAPPGMTLTKESMADEMIRDVLEGVETTGIRAGIIGEIGMQWPGGEWERMSLQAAARAQKETGAAITIHLGRSPNSPFEVIDVLSKAGADLTRVVLCHIERTVFDYKRLVDLGRTGCYLGYDTFSIEGVGENRVRMVLSEDNPVKMDWPSDAQRVNAILRLIEDGFLSQILVSSDMCRKHRLWRYGGPGYAHILQNVVPLMKQKGMSEGHIRALLVENPKRLLTFH